MIDSKRGKRMKNNILDIYASDVFSDAVMQERLPKKVYQSLKATIQTGSDLSLIHI